MLHSADLKTKTSWFIWLTFAVLVCVLTFFAHHLRSVSVNYWVASHHWLHGMQLYANTGTGFIYPPQSAILYIPFGVLPFYISELLWRLLSLGVFVWGLYRFSSLISQYDAHTKSKPIGFYFLLLTLTTLCISFASARNGQMHLLTTGLMMAAVAVIPEQKWQQAAVLLLLAFALKITALVLLLLVGALYWQIGWRLMLGLILYAVFPFFTQKPAYVWSQYLAFLDAFQISMNVGIKQPYAQLFGLLSQEGWKVSAQVQTSLRLLFAFAVLIFGYAIHKKNTLTVAAIWLFILSMCYLMLFNPRTEGNDYIMLAPAMGFVLSYVIVRKKYFQTGMLIAMLVVLIFGYYIAKIITPGHVTWVAPLIGVLFSCMLFFVRPRSSQFRSSQRSLLLRSF